MAGRHNRRIVGYEKDIQEFIPCTPKSPAPSEPDPDGTRPLDEIALLKRGNIDKDGHRKMRGKKGENVPISLKELNERSLKLEDGKILYMPPKKDDLVSQSTARSVSEVSYHVPFSSISNGSLIDEVQSTTLYRVGVPQEKATLELGETKNGKRYDFRVGDFQLLMQVTDKATFIVAMT